MLEFERINNVLLTGMSEVGDVLLIRQTLSNLIQVEIRVNGYLLDLITIKPKKLKIYPLVGIKKNALILVQEVSVGLDMTLENNRTFRNFNFFRRLKQESQKKEKEYMWRWVWRIVRWILINLLWEALWGWVKQWFSKQEELLCGVGYGKL